MTLIDQRLEEVFDFRHHPSGAPICVSDALEIGWLKPRLIDLLILAGICESKTEATKMIQQGAVRLNDAKVTQVDRRVDWTDIRKHPLPEGYGLIRFGTKRAVAAIEIERLIKPKPFFEVREVEG